MLSNHRCIRGRSVQPLELLERFTHAVSGPVGGFALAVASFVQDAVEDDRVESQRLFDGYESRTSDELELREIRLHPEYEIVS